MSLNHSVFKTSDGRTRTNSYCITLIVSVLLNNVQIPRADTFTCLGVDLDEKLSWEKHIEKTCGKVSAGIGAMRRIKPFVPPVTLQTIYKTLVQPYFDYCSPLWDNCGKVLGTPR